MSDNNSNFGVTGIDDDFVRDDELESLDAWDGKSAPPAEGSYLVSIDTVEQKTSSKGNPMLAVELRIVSNADGTSSTQEGRLLRAWYVQTGKGKKRLKAFLEAAGAMRDGGYSKSALNGAKFCVDVTHEKGEYTNIETGVKTPTVNARVTGERRAA